MSSIYGAGLAGIQAATAGLYAHSQNVSAAFQPGAKAVVANGGGVQQTGDSVDISQELAGLSTSSAQMGASVAVINSGAQMQKTLLDMLA